ncbi:helix-turn-helix domain-containing protein [Evansella sp. AB-P1]|uniref:PucR family transcriptional regulator n=1 Tax=Evansella sp. AB-P1 TaxID=3037653 RepID=UPI00241C86C2|nr:helix-turn-helix domain-containing protein [Evansella sp. AB-P1]MDG5786381.1 helix-turn-helix domain-containing protein [Evansella sp. AB-P1]
MLNRLKDNYAHAISNNFNDIPSTYRLKLSDHTGDSIIFDKRNLSSDEIQLLETLFNSNNDAFYTPKNEKEQILYNLLVESMEPDLTILKKSYTSPFRFVYFYIQGSIGDHGEFEEALKNLFSSSQEVLWINSNHGFFIQLMNIEEEEEIPIDSIVDTIASDFFVQLYVYVGSSMSNVEDMKERFIWEKDMFDVTRQVMPSKKIFIEHEIIPYLLLRDIKDTTKNTLITMLSPVIDDQQLLESVKFYLECNMNTSLAAKKMFMHRNTLQYRVDKFIEKTSIDIKRFPNAVAVYFLFILLQHTHPDD